MKNLAQKLALATTLALAPLTTQAQHYHHPPRHHHSIPIIIPIYPIEIYSAPPRQPSNLEILKDFLPFNHLQPNTKKNRTQFASRTNFFVYTWQDINKNGKFDFKSEMRGMDRKTFLDNENIYLGFQTLRLNNRTQAVELISPTGHKIGRDSKIVESDIEFWYAQYRNPQASISKYGEGNYTANFYIDGTCVGHRTFELKGKKRNLEQKTENFPGLTIPSQKPPKMSQKEFDYYQREKAMHREQHEEWAKQNPYSPIQQKILQQFYSTIRQRANAMNKGNPKRRADPIGYNLTETEILQIHKTYKNFSEKNIQKFYSNRK